MKQRNFQRNCKKLPVEQPNSQFVTTGADTFGLIRVPKGRLIRAFLRAELALSVEDPSSVA
jgi:hypothetical protein